MQGLESDEIRRRLIGAINEAQRKVRSNYKMAVPQYYEGKIQLLLPLCLTPGSPNPDLALVTHKISSNTYTARTCLTLKMAYNNARLIVNAPKFLVKTVAGFKNSRGISSAIPFNTCHWYHHDAYEFKNTFIPCVAPLTLIMRCISAAKASQAAADLRHSATVSAVFLAMAL